jgi:hypothetical protein
MTWRKPTGWPTYLPFRMARGRAISGGRMLTLEPKALGYWKLQVPFDEKMSGSGPSLPSHSQAVARKTAPILPLVLKGARGRQVFPSGKRLSHRFSGRMAWGKPLFSGRMAQPVKRRPWHTDRARVSRRMGGFTGGLGGHHHPALIQRPGGPSGSSKHSPKLWRSLVSNFIQTPPVK